MDADFFVAGSDAHHTRAERKKFVSSSKVADTGALADCFCVEVVLLQYGLST